MLRQSQTPIRTTSDGTIPYLWHWYRINGVLTTEDTVILIPFIHQSYVCFFLQTNSISSHQVKQRHPQTTLWNQCWTPPMTLQSFNNPNSIPLSTIQWRVRHKGNLTHVANSNEIRCGIHKENGHYIVNCTKEQWFDNQWRQQSIISVVPALAWPESPSFGLALGSLGFVTSQTKSKAKKLAWPGLALA